MDRLQSNGGDAGQGQERIHLLGIGGSGMRPLAELAASRGFQVSGSDHNLSENVEKLRKRGITVHIEHEVQNLPPLPCQVVISSAIAAENPVLKEARSKGYRVAHRSDLLHDLMRGKKAICVSGTHGKSTTSAMVAYMLHSLGLDPEAALGAEIVGTDTASFSGQGDYFVAECDESDGTFTKYEPFLSVVTNIDIDHLNHHKNLENLKSAFLEFLGKTDKDGAVILGTDNQSVRDITAKATGRCISFGTGSHSDVKGLGFQSCGHQFTYQALVGTEKVDGRMNLVGRHNLQNALCALAVAQSLNLDIRAAASAIATFPGVKRRLTLTGEIGQTKIYDDFAHNPGKIQSSIAGVREAFPSERLLVIFQAYGLYRLETMYQELVGSFGDADEVLVLPPKTVGVESTDHPFSPTRLAADISAANGKRAIPYSPGSLGSLFQGSTPPTVLLVISVPPLPDLHSEIQAQLQKES